MKTYNFEIGRIYIKGNNMYMFRGMIGKDFLFWVRSNENEPYESLKVLAPRKGYPGMIDILDNLK